MFKVGQIVFLLIKNTAIYPAVISEEIHVKSLEDESIKYKVIWGPKVKRKTADIDNIEDCVVFNTLEEVRTYLFKGLNDYINGLLDSAKDQAQEWYGQSVNSTTSKKSNPFEDENNSTEEEQLTESPKVTIEDAPIAPLQKTEQIITMPDGQKVKISL